MHADAVLFGWLCVTADKQGFFTWLVARVAGLLGPLGV